MVRWWSGFPGAPLLARCLRRRAALPPPLTMPRVLLLLFALSAGTLVFVAKCGINFASDPGVEVVQHGILNIPVPNKDFFAELLRNQEEKHKAEIGRLKDKIVQLELELHEAKLAAVEGVGAPNSTAVLNNQDALLQQGGVNPDQKDASINCQQHTAQALFYTEFLKGKVDASEITQGVSLHNEYEIIPYVRFTLKRIYLVDPGMGKRVVEKPIGFRKKDLQEVIAYSIEKLNLQRKGSGVKKYSAEDFVEGIYRTEPSLGSHYTLVFRDQNNQSNGNYQTVTLTRSFAPLQLVDTKRIQAKSETINLILPLSGRTEKFQGFLNRFARVCIKGDKNVFLTVVYFGTEGLNEVKNLMGHISKQFRFQNMKLVTLNENFSRGRGLQVGAQSWLDGTDVLMFLCDVDIVFNMEFLDRCRLNAERGRRVYYPMVFSLYNPNVVYRLHNLDVPSEEDQLIISKDTGFWRDFGFGMTCQYRSDFLNIKGFDEEITGWGMEDVYLYRKYVKSELMVVRATDPGIFHLWHEKHCDPKLTWDQYRGCIRSKALNEASHAQLGMLAFKEEVDVHKSLVQQRVEQKLLKKGPGPAVVMQKQSRNR